MGSKYLEVNGGYVESDLLPGDILLYNPKGFYGWLIALKTWHMIAHCENYIGHGRVVASRNGIGVNEYDLNLDNIRLVMRPPIPPFDLNKALSWYERKARGQKYDWKGLLRFTTRKPYAGIISEDASFCSEFSTRFLRMGNVPVFNLLDADDIAPFQFAGESLLRLVIPASQVTGET